MLKNFIVGWEYSIRYAINIHVYLLKITFITLTPLINISRLLLHKRFIENSFLNTLYYVIFLFLWKIWQSQNLRWLMRMPMSVARLDFKWTFHSCECWIFVKFDQHIFNRTWAIDIYIIIAFSYRFLCNCMGLV